MHVVEAGNHGIRWREKTEIREKIKGKNGGGGEERKKKKGIMDFSPSPTRRSYFTKYFF